LLKFKQSTVSAATILSDPNHDSQWDLPYKLGK
jgi:hypothetical protein